MKRLLWPMILILLLCGCGESVPEETTTTPVATTIMAPTTEPTEPVGIYVPFSDLETQTDGHVRYYLPEQDCCGIRMMEEDLLVFSGSEKTILTRYAGQQLFAVAGTELECWVDPQDPSFQISNNGITYYNPDTREVIFLDNDLKEVRRLEMPADMVGKPVLSANRIQVYYCTAEAVRVYDTAANLDKLIKTIAYPVQTVEKVLLNDTVLCCALTDEKDQQSLIFISCQTGAMLSQIPRGMDISTYGDICYAKVPEGIQELLVFSGRGQNAQMLTPADPFARSWFLKESHGLVTATVTEAATVLDYYDLASGLRTAAVELPSGIAPQWVEIQQDSGAVLVLAYDPMAEAPVILSWQKEATGIADETIYTGPRYTAQNPDTAGLEACKTLAEEIGAKYGLRILIGQEAVEHQPWDYTLELEHHPAVLRRQLERLDEVLAQFPEGLFRKLSWELAISIVRSIGGNAESGSLASAQGLQFWDGNQPYVALAAGETLGGAFFHEVFHVLDGKILSDTRVYYHWNNLNPDGFRYFEDYTSYLEADAEKYLQEETRAFIDAYSMSYPKEDRARIMEYACQEGNAHYFQSDIMQNKLKTLCQGIRKTFGLEKYQQSLLWEQYLKEPLKIK